MGADQMPVKDDAEFGQKPADMSEGAKLRAIVVEAANGGDLKLLRALAEALLKLGDPENNERIRQAIQEIDQAAEDFAEAAKSNQEPKDARPAPNDTGTAQVSKNINQIRQGANMKDKAAKETGLNAIGSSKSPK